MIKRYKKKPITIEAVQFVYNGETLLFLHEWMGDALGISRKARHPDAIGKLEINTLEGTMISEEGDYIIKGVEGEFYSCKKDIFEKTYEAEI